MSNQTSHEKRLSRWGKLLLLPCVASLLLSLEGCVVVPRDNSLPTATDVVCLCNGDLGCVTITVREDTPRVERDGKTYYFCSDHCRELFLKEPEKYAALLPK